MKLWVHGFECGGIDLIKRRWILQKGDGVGQIRMMLYTVENLN